VDVVAWLADIVDVIGVFGNNEKVKLVPSVLAVFELAAVNVNVVPGQTDPEDEEVVSVRFGPKFNKPTWTVVLPKQPALSTSTV
jgi:hypothetical protein